MKRVLELTPKGLYCAAGDFYIDPSSKVPTAIVTHGHTDHTCKGSDTYICSENSAGIIQQRVSKKAVITPKKFGEQFTIGNALVSLHPAGHILGSAQVRVETQGEVWVVSGDYKRENDPTCEPFEVVPCDVFITEATFALPQYEWAPSSQIVKSIYDWWQTNKKSRTPSIIFCYSLGKAQRILGELARHTNETVHVHSTLEPFVAHYRAAGIKLLPTEPIPEVCKGNELILAPTSLQKTFWFNQLEKYESASVSGWMLNSPTQGFALSDHVDWPSLLKTIEQTGAHTVYATHGYTRQLVRHLRDQGLQAHPLEYLSNSPKEIFSKLQATLNDFIY